MIYRDSDDLLTRLEYYLTHEREREQLANSLYQQVLAKHTWFHRVRDMMTVIEQILSSCS